ncbi:MAG: sn-glycerol-3-phosphate ABC transporter ATP-binding protein UgpC [Hyphomicrobiaceae bacterium]|nr:sn-glycerol-3-phosphate ABC transporter ATP-binding protein UgpC [Hyphomicrobiaceae bacterium]
MTTALSIKSLFKSYGSVEILKDISVSIEKGEFLVLVGPSGCGKSTLLNCIAGLEDVTAGTIEINGRDVTQIPPKDRDIAMVFQSYALYPTMSVGENIGFGMRIRHVPQTEINQRTGDVARLLQIDHLLDRRPSQLSGGQRQRVAMGRALVRDPALFLFDEPLSNLDAKLRVEMRGEIKKLHETTGTSIVYVTHDQIEAMTLATKIVVLKDGIVQQVGTPDEIYNSPQTTFVADFMGSPPMNLIAASTDPDSSAVKFGNDQVVHVPGLADKVSARSSIIVGIRPEDFSIGGELKVTPISLEHTGSDNFVSFKLGETVATARLSGRAHLSHSEMGFSVDTSHMCFFDTQTGDRI